MKMGSFGQEFCYCSVEGRFCESFRDAIFLRFLIQRFGCLETCH